MAVRRAAQAASTLALGGALTLGLAGTASAAPIADLSGMGCPTSYTNYYGNGGFVQTLTYTYTGGNGYRYGHYNVVFRNNFGDTNEGSRDYRCY
ncbi:hypothetical protein [Kitasatospora cheerisanensis]|uniref:Uncharacterized protein n=1 Tax=Kitasatospora cheerisanensis KCTC 2395 TaxID=1348663 RepID=A0A066ZB30_9ACTN|nr:hypothetical protein [Kitasatospora cheerisanensis]KDN87526.1 hypothetical protein KCH_07420 [Kitasatospora cheerisanensis KCTC 2395]